MMSLWDALRMNMMISYQELVRTFLSIIRRYYMSFMDGRQYCWAFVLGLSNMNEGRTHILNLLI